MDKQAVDLLNLALLSLLAGGGTYAGARGVKDLANELSPQEPEKNELEITLPKSRMPALKQKMGEEDTSALGYTLPVLAGVGGGLGGFHLASSIYEKLKERSLANQKNKVEKDYLSTLMHAHQKMGSVQTPHVDTFLEGILCKIGEEFEKNAWGVDPEFATNGGVSDLATGALKAGGKAFAGSEMGKLTGAGMLLTALLTGGLTYGTAKRMSDNNEERERKTSIPTDVRLRLI